MGGTGQENQNNEAPQQTELTRRQFLKRAGLKAAALGAAAVGSKDTKADYSPEGSDPKIQAVLEREGVRGVHLRMYFGNHFFTEGTMKKMEAQGVTVITGELNFTPGTGRMGGDETKSASREFFFNLKKLPNGVTGLGQMQLRSQRSARLLEKFSKGRAILASDNEAGGAAIQDAANEALVGWGLFGSLLYFGGLAWKTGLLAESKNPISRRNFLKGTALGVGAGVTGYLASALYQTAENRGWIEPPANTEVSYIYSKLFSLATVDVSTKALEIAGDKRLLQAFQALINVRNKVMSLNNWYFIESLERNRGLRQGLTGSNGFVEMGFFAGSGHSGAKDEFCKGPAKLGVEIEAELNGWLDQYDHDMAAAASSEDEKQVLNYYQRLMTAFGRPYLISQLSIKQEGSGLDNYIPAVDTPAAIMYRTLANRIREGHSTGQSVNNYEQLVAGLVKDQHFPDGTFINVSGKNVLFDGKYHGEMTAKDPNALKNRFIESGFMSPDDLQLIGGEIYPELYAYDYIGPVIDKRVLVGIAIVGGMPITYFQKEDTSFIKRQ